MSGAKAQARMASPSVIVVGAVLRGLQAAGVPADAQRQRGAG
jgi:hypothetical protein